MRSGRIRRVVVGAVVWLALLLAGGCNVVCELTDWCDQIPEELRKALTETYIVGLDAEPGQVLADIDTIQRATAEIFEWEPLHVFQEVTQGFTVEMPLGARDAMLELDEVDYIVVDPTRTYGPQPERKPPQLGQGEVTEGIRRVGGPASTDVSSLEVAVVDTGIDLDHPELNVVGSFDAVAEAGGEDSGGDDLNGHGTHVAGTIGAKADGQGVAGVAPGVGLHAVRVLDSSGDGTLGDIIAGLEYVAKQPRIKVVNMSLGGPWEEPQAPQPLRDAIQKLIEKGVVVCIAAGNESADTEGFLPAGYDLGVVVSAYDAYGGSDNGFADFSNYGGEVDVAAPGVDITSTVPGGEYAALSGTSMATPHVAGAAAAYIGAHPDATPAEVASAIKTQAESGYSGQTGRHPEPLLDVAALLD